MTNPEQDFQQRYEREREARLSAESLLESKCRELDESNVHLKELSDDLEKLVSERTADLETARDEALDSVKAKSEFLANMSHELRTPLNGVLGMMHVLEKNVETKKQARLVATALESGSLLLTIINDVLEFSKIDSAGIELESIPFNLTETLESCMQGLATTVNRKQLELVSAISPNLPVSMQGDPTRIKQIITNLISNAIKFTERGQVVLYADYTGDGEVRIAVTDTGIGMTEQQCQSIFRAFAQADTSITRKYGGTGLGLSICSFIAEAMESSIEIKSQPDQGSTFSFSLRLPVLDSASNCDLCGDEIGVIYISESSARKKAMESFFAHMPRVSFAIFDSLSDVVSRIWDTDTRWKLIFDTGPLDHKAHEQCDKLRAAIPGLRIIELLDYEQMDTNKFTDFQTVKPIKQKEFIHALTSDSSGGKQIDHDLDLDKLFDFSGKTMLVVDDNAINLEVAKQMFAETGVTIELCQSGAEAIAAVSGKDFDLVLMDVQMPEMDGLSAARAIRNMGGKFASLPIVALTAHATRQDVEKSLAAGMNDHLTKPIDPTRVLPVLAKWLYSGSADGEVAANKVAQDQTSRSNPLAVKPENDVLSSPPDIPQLDGFDIDDAMLRMRGNWEFLRKMIITFAQSKQNADVELVALLKKRKFKDAEHLVHQIRGSGANLSAVAISETAGKIERLLKNKIHDVPDKLMDRFAKCVQSLKQSGELLQQGNDLPDTEKPSASVPNKVVRKIDKLQVGKLLSSISDHLHSDLGKAKIEIESLHELTDNTDYSDISNEIEQSFAVFKLNDIDQAIEKWMF